jgi:hypothetical protein
MLAATELTRTTLNTCLQDCAATQLPRIDTKGHLFTTSGKGIASVANRKVINAINAWFQQSNPTFLMCLILNASARAQEHAPVKGNMWTELQMEWAMMEF